MVMDDFFRLRNCRHSFIQHGEYVTTINKELKCLIHVDQCDETSVFDCLTDSTYDKLIEFLNTYDNFSIALSRIEYTTTDFIIVKNKVFDNVDEMLSWWVNNRPKELIGFKYVIADYETKTFSKF